MRTSNLSVINWRTLFFVLAWMSTLVSAMAQQESKRVAYLTSNQNEERLFLHQMKESLRTAGWTEGKNLQLIARYATGAPLSYESSARELVALKPDLIFAAGAPPLRVLSELTRDIPLVTTDFSSDPVALGYAVSYARPGRNVTGVFLDAPQIAGKWLEILRALVPGLNRVTVLWHPETGSTHLQAIKRISLELGIRTLVNPVRTVVDVHAALATAKGRRQAVIILPSPLAYAHSAELAELCLKLRLPAASIAKGFAENGGLVSYGPNLAELNKRAFALAVRVLQGEKPSALPIETPARFDFVINAGAARSLSLKVPDRLLMGAEIVGQ